MPPHSSQLATPTFLLNTCSFTALTLMKQIPCPDVQSSFLLSQICLLTHSFLFSLFCLLYMDLTKISTFSMSELILILILTGGFEHTDTLLCFPALNRQLIASNKHDAIQVNLICGGGIEDKSLYPHIFSTLGMCYLTLRWVVTVIQVTCMFSKSLCCRARALK